MKLRRLILIIATILGTYAGLKAQVVFNFVPEVYARTIDGLSACVLINSSGASVNGHVNITVSELNSGNEILTILTAPATYAPGSNQISPQAFHAAQFQFSNSNLAAIINQTRQIPPGSYQFCFEFVPGNHNMPAMESCFEALVQPLVPISLIQPMDQDTICNKRPLLTWQPPLPLQANMRFRLQLTEKREGQGPEALLQTVPLLLLDQIIGSSLVYPSNYPELIEGRTYYWQVFAYQNGLIVSTSEIWEFTVQCQEETPASPGFSYRELRSIANGNYYYANRFLRFSLNNPYVAYGLNYTVTSLKNGNETIRDLPKIQVKPGHNQIDIDLSLAGLVDGNEYLLRVSPFNEQPVQVRFIYKENPEELKP